MAMNSSDTTQIEVRPATLADAREIARVWLSALGPGHSGLLSIDEADAAFRARIASAERGSFIWVAFDGKDVVGWQGLADFGSTQITRAGMSSTYVSPASHGKGVGRQLLRCATEGARDLGFDYVVGFIRSDNASCIKIVISLGWKLVGALPRISEVDPELSYYAYAVPKS